MPFRLPRWPRNTAIVDPKTGIPTITGQRWQQSTVEAIETQEATQDQMLADIALALEQAGIALDQAGALMPDIAPVTINANYSGSVLAGQLPRNVQAQRFDGETDVTTDAAWTATTVSGNATYTIGAATGIVNITAIETTTVINVVSEYNAIPRSRKLTVYKVLADPPPSSGTGSSSAYDSSITETTSDSYGIENAGPLTLTCGASGEVTLSAPLTTLTEDSVARHVFGKWQYRLSGGGAWTDVDTEIQSSIAASGPETGYIAVNQLQTGLTPASDYEFQLLLRNQAAVTTVYYAGSASAVTE